MNPLFRLVLIFFATVMPLVTGSATADDDLQRLLYVTVPDGAMKSPGKPGIYVYDIDDGHRLVKHISIPDMGGTRGAVASPAAKKLWYSHKNTNVACLDLITEEKAWEVSFPKEQGGADRICVTPDGRKLYVPEGWWTGASKKLKVLDADSGRLRGTIDMPSGTGHNTIMSPSGERMYWGPVNHGEIVVVDTRTERIVKQFGPFGGRVQDDGSIRGGRVSPYTINGKETLCFVNTRHVGFYVGDLVNQKVLHWVQVDEANGFSHGVGMTPNEKEIWLTNPNDKRLWVFDATVMPPKRVRSIDVSSTSHGWITFSLDGRFAWPDTGDVIDAQTKEIIATLKGIDGQGVVRSSKFIEIHFRDGVPVRVGDQFGIGRVTE